MRTWGWGIALLGLLGAAAIASAQPPKSKAMPEGWWRDLFGPSKPKAEFETPDSAPKPPTVDRSAELERLENALMRRIGVCDRLREIAQTTGNESLHAEADRLEELAARVHRQQSARMGLRVRTLEGDDPLPESLQTPPGTASPVRSPKEEGKR